MNKPKRAKLTEEEQRQLDRQIDAEVDDFIEHTHLDHVPPLTEGLGEELSEYRDQTY